MNFRCNTYLEVLGAYIAKLREDKGLSQSELANQSGISLSQIGRIELGEINPTSCTLQLIAQALNLHVSQLYPANLPKIDIEKLPNSNS